MLVVGRIRLDANAGIVGLCDEVIPSLLLTEVDRILSCTELERGALHVVGRGGPADERVLPAGRALQDVPVHSPVVRAGLSRGVGRLGGLEDSHSALVQLG